MTLVQSIQNIIRDHALYSWSADASKLLSNLKISFVKAVDAGEVTSGLCIPIDLDFESSSLPNSFTCFGISLQVISPLNIDSFPDFTIIPEYEWLWKNKHGALMLAFNFAGYIDFFICNRFIKPDSKLDKHGRQQYESSTLKQLNLDHIPLLNKYLYAILAVAYGNKMGQAAKDPSRFILPPVIILSHDCDQLRGNDLITQAIRLYRFFAPICRLRMPAFLNVWHIIRNFFYPKLYYFEDALAMQYMEVQYGFRSVFYLLNGSGGRFGARSGSLIIKDFSKKILNSFEIGIHYNYRYAFDANKLQSQIDEITHLTGRVVRSGRAHYLIYDPIKSSKIIAQCGIKADESIGFIENNSFRLGFAGAYRLTVGLQDNQSIVEIPLSFMDRNTVGHHNSNDFYKMLSEVEKVGGIVTLLFHPGCFNNPEFPDMKGQYISHLHYFHKKNYRCMLPYEIDNLIN